MAKISSGWYKGKINFHEVTDISIVRTINGGYDESWDGSIAQDGSIMCYRTDTKVTIICSDDVTEIGDNAFSKFLALKNISGLNSVTTLGAYSFTVTHNIKSIDIDPVKIISIGEGAFYKSSAEDILDFSIVPLDSVGDMATRHKRWSTEGLAAVQNVPFTQSTYIDVPNMDCQFLYPHIQYGVRDGEPCYADKTGCTSFAFYHIWNAMFAGTDKQYDNWLDWFNGEVNTDGTYPSTNVFDGTTRQRLTAKLGWSLENAILINSASQLQTILEHVQKRHPVYLSIHSSQATTGYHGVAVIGCDAKTRKLAIVDSSVLEDRGVVYWVSFEDIFVGGTSEYDAIYLVNFNFPVLAPNCTWFTQGNTSIKRSAITKINIVDSYINNGNSVISWDASEAKDGSIMVYVDGTELTIAGNGTGRIYANSDSSNLFSDSSSADYFSNVEAITGGNLLDTANATTMLKAFNYCQSLLYDPGVFIRSSNVAACFQRCQKLKVLDASKWDLTQTTTLQNTFYYCTELERVINISTGNTGNNTNIRSMCSKCYALVEFDASKIDVKNVTTFYGAFGECRSLTKLDVSTWSTSNATDISYVFTAASSIKELDLSSWDTSNATTTKVMFDDLLSLQKITLGEKFSLDAFGKITDSTNIGKFYNVNGVNGDWYDVNLNVYNASEIPNGKFGIYYATPEFAEKDANQMVLIKKGNLMKTTDAIRTKTGSNKGYEPSEFAKAILNIVNNDSNSSNSSSNENNLVKVTITGTAPYAGGLLYYSNCTGTVQSSIPPDFGESITINLQKNSILLTTNNCATLSPENTLFFRNETGVKAYFITDNTNFETT